MDDHDREAARARATPDREAPAHPALPDVLARSSALHEHLCPRQVLGARLGLTGGALLDIRVPQGGKRLLTVVETDGCGCDGVAVATNCWVGHRTLRIADYGKMAATFVDTESGRAVRVWPQPSARAAAAALVPGAPDRWHAMLLGYQRLGDAELLDWRPVTLTTPIERIVSAPGRRVVCASCGEEIMNDRQVRSEGAALCRACAGDAYYEPAAPGR